MKFHFQQFKHDPANGIEGDCQRAVFACMLDLELSDVPHFAQECVGDADFWYRVSKWLLERGLCRRNYLVDGDLDQVLAEFAAEYSAGEYMVAGKSERARHVVVAKGNKIIWDTLTGVEHSLITPYAIDPDDGTPSWMITTLEEM